MLTSFKKLLILSHRYIGIPLSFMFVVWFLSAFVMIYAGGMPRITAEMRIEAGSTLALDSISISPQQALDIAGYEPDSANLRTILGRPVYVFREGRLPPTFIFADNGDVLSELNEVQAQLMASDFLNIPSEQFHLLDKISEIDQWTISNARQLPLLKFAADDGLGTQVYVSQANAEVAIYTTSQSRLLAWLGTIPHWLYFTALRANQPLWYDIVVWSSGLACVLAFLGLLMGVTQFRKVRPFSLARAIPYQGWMRWHYILGCVFGVFMLTWVFSGLLSMEPFAWTNVKGLDIDQEVYHEGNLDLAAFPELAEVDWDGLVDGDIKEVELSWIQGQPYFLASYIAGNSEVSGSDAQKRERLHQPYNIIGQAESSSVLIDALNFKQKASFDIETLVSKLDNSIASTKVLEYEVLTAYDDYYYSRNGQIPLPVLRVKFDDPDESWVYVDMARSQLLTMVHKWSRVERWLYSGLHSLDFAFWYHQRPLWDLGVIFLLLGGLMSSGIGFYFGLRRLKNDVLACLAKIK